jgi:hypothetical protein
MEKTESTHDRRAQTIAFLTSFMNLASIIVALSVKSSPAIQIIALVVAVTVAVVGIYTAFGQSLVSAARGTAKAIRHRYVAPTYLDRLAGFVKRLDRLCDRCYTGNPACILCRFPELWGGPFTDPPVLGHAAGFVGVLRLVLSTSRRGKKNLVFSVRWFQLVLDMYNRQCVCEPARQVIIRVEQGLDEGKKLQYERLKREYQKAKLGYVTLLEDYAKFARDLNSAFGESIASDYFERPDEL